MDELILILKLCSLGSLKCIQSVKPLGVNLIGNESVSLLARITVRLKNKVKSEQQEGEH